MIDAALHLALIDTLDAACDTLVAKGVALPDALKRRDKREPGRKEKEAAEDKLYAATRRHWKRQAEKIEQAVILQHPERKAITDTFPWLLEDEWWEDPDFERDLVLLLTQAAKSGIVLFQEQVMVGMDYTMTNAEAAKWARRYTYDLIRGIDDTTRKAVREAVTAFVETPGMTVGDVMRGLPFDERRAETVATTEITRAYAEGQRMAGEDLQREYPDVRVVKQWTTNNDDRVCLICGPLDGVEVELSEAYPGGYDGPPAHVNCRCWQSTRTRINA